ncbi:MAG: TolC family outer membrane protein [Sphingomonadales bacterium]
MRYRLIAALLGMVWLGGLPTGAGAETLREALAAAYIGNPTIEAERAALRAQDETVSQARSGYRPSVVGTGSIARSNNRQTSSFAGQPTETETTLTPKTAGVSLVQPVFRGFRTTNEVSQAATEVDAGRARLLAVEQDILLAAASAYLDVIRDEAILELTRNNVQVLNRQLEASRDRFRVGEITRTDVAQAEARLSGSISLRTQAEAALTASRAAYNRVVGRMPGTLSYPELPELPASQEAALEVALAENPGLEAARFIDRASDYAVRAAKGALLPEVSLRAEYRREWDSSEFISDVERKQIMAELRVPFYQAGVAASGVRQARQISSQRRLQVLDAERQVVEGLRNAWESLREARSRIESDEAQVRANEIALEGVRQEAAVGSRTTLDVLDAEQELLDSRVSLTTAQHNVAVASFDLLSAMGRLTARNLNLPVAIYDPARNYDRVRNKIFGWGIEDE